MFTAALFLFGITAFCQKKQSVAFHPRGVQSPLPSLKTESSAKALESFHRDFPEITDAKISQQGSIYTISFKNEKDNSSNRVYYDKKGNIVQTIMYYSEKDLPPFIRAKVGSKFPGKTISNVTEFISNKEHFYEIALEDNNSLFITRFNTNGIMYNKKKYGKSK